MEEGNQDKENINQLKIKGIPIIAIMFPIAIVHGVGIWFGAW